MTDSNSARERAIRYVEAHLLRRGWSKILMLNFTVVAALMGFLASIWLHAVGMDSMAIRYPLSVGIAYMVFLLELSFFVSHHRANRKTFVDDSILWHFTDLSGVQQVVPTGGGGRGSPATLAEKTDGGTGGGGGGFDAGGINGDGIVVVLLILVAIVSTVLTSLFVINQAPLLLAEALVDGVLFFGIARRMNRISNQHWISGVMRRTLVPLLILVVGYSAIGIGLQSIAPKVTTMAEAFCATHHR